MDSPVLKLKAINRKLPGFEKEKQSTWSGPFCFIQGADTQLGMTASYIEQHPEKGWEIELELTKKAIAAANSLSPKPRFFIVCGDLIDAMPDTTYRKGQEDDFVRVFKELNPDIPLICVCGNHDVGNTPTPETVKSYTDKFGDDYFTFFCAGVMFIVINSQFYEDSTMVQDLAAEQEAWLDKQLEEAVLGNYKHVIVFQHIPPFLKSPDEEKIYFNLLPEVREKLLKKLYDANVRAIFCGHWHGNSTGFYKELEVVTTSAIGCQLRGDKSGFRIVTLTNDAINHKYYCFHEVPKTISLE